MATMLPRRAVPDTAAARTTAAFDFLGIAGAARAASPWRLAVILVAAYLAVMIWVGHQRVLGDYLKETDFYHLYAPDADRIRSGLLPVQTNNTGPAYPLLLALAFGVTGDNFTSG